MQYRAIHAIALSLVIQEVCFMGSLETLQSQAMTRNELVTLLENLLAGVEDKTAFEGSLSYTPQEEGSGFVVSAAIRWID